MFIHSADGKLYRWSLATGALAQSVPLTAGLEEVYTPTLIGPDGIVYVIKDGTLFAVGASRLHRPALQPLGNSVPVGVQVSPPSDPSGTASGRRAASLPDNSPLVPALFFRSRLIPAATNVPGALAEQALQQPTTTDERSGDGGSLEPVQVALSDPGFAESSTCTPPSCRSWAWTRSWSASRGPSRSATSWH